MSIERTNYEIWFLDYCEGRLSPEQRAEVEAFVLLHPDLAAELDEMKDFMLSASFDAQEEVFDIKDALKKPESGFSPQELEWLLVKELEGDLSADEQRKLEALKAAFPSMQRDAALYAHTKLSAIAEQFEAKSTLHFSEAIDLNDPQMLMAAEVEGDLNKEQQARLHHAIAAHPHLKRERALMALAHAPQSAEVFDAKDKLYKKATPVIVLFNRWAFTAAAAAVVGILFWWSTQSGISTDSGVAQQSPTEKTAPVLPNDSTGTTPNNNATDAAPAIAPGNGTNTPENSDAPRVPRSVRMAPAVENEGQTAQQTPIPVGPSPQLEEPTTAPENNVAQQVPATPVAPTPAYTNTTPAEATAANAPQRSTPKQAMTIWEFAEDKAKSALWGSNDYPKDAFAAALVQKEIQRRNEEKKVPASISVQDINEGDERRQRLRIGKFEISRVRSKK